MFTSFENQTEKFIDKINEYRKSGDSDKLKAEEKSLSTLLESFNKVISLLGKEDKKVYADFIKEVKKRSELETSKSSSKKGKKSTKKKDKSEKSKSKETPSGKWWD